MKSSLPVVFLGLGAVLAASPAARAGCSVSVPLLHSRIGTPEGGGFDLKGTAFDGKDTPPQMRFWVWGSYTQANSAEEDQQLKGFEWLVNPVSHFKVQDVGTGVYSLNQCNWYAPKVKGCVLDQTEKRTVVELSFADPGAEGSKSHQGYYAVASVGIAGGAFDFDQVRGASGASGNIVAATAIPAPSLLAVEESSGTRVLTVEVPAPVSYSEKGMNDPVKLVKGYRILFAKGTEPTSSEPDAYKPAMDPQHHDKEAGVIVEKGKVAVPAGDDVWVVSQVVYEDPTLLTSNATSGHVQAARGAEPAGGGRARGGDSKRGH